MFLSWMAWTWQTAIFFGFIALCLITLTLLAIYRPETPRRGILRFPTTRGDRFFISLLVTAYVFIAWFRFGLGDVLYWPLVIGIAFAVAIFRYV
jgi:predicted small integral membrane protein